MVGALAEPCGLCCVKSRMADSARLVTGVSPGRSWNFASRSGPLMTAVVRWSMPQLCPKITSLPAQSPYILFKRSRAASCGSGSSEPSSGSCFVANCQQPAQQPRPAAGDRAGRPAVLAMAGQRSPVAEVADRLAADRSPTALTGSLLTMVVGRGSVADQWQAAQAAVVAAGAAALATATASSVAARSRGSARPVPPATPPATSC